METLETDVNMVEQNGKHDPQAETNGLSEDIFKSNSSSSNLSSKSTKQSKIQQQNGDDKHASPEDIILEE
jgi:hypothetical protein